MVHVAFPPLRPFAAQAFNVRGAVVVSLIALNVATWGAVVYAVTRVTKRKLES